MWIVRLYFSTAVKNPFRLRLWLAQSGLHCYIVHIGKGALQFFIGNYFVKYPLEVRYPIRDSKRNPSELKKLSIGFKSCIRFIFRGYGHFVITTFWFNMLNIMYLAISSMRGSEYALKRVYLLMVWEWAMTIHFFLL